MTLAGSPDIASIIRDRAEAYGVDPDVLLRHAQVESGLDPNSANPSSSAKGLFQFIDGTWKQYGNGADPLDPVANADAGARFMANNQKLLRSANVEPTPGALYLSHFAGPGGALKAMRADPSASVADVLGVDAVRANPFLAKMSIADLRAWADRKMAAPGAPAVAGTQVATAAPAPGGGLALPAADPAGEGAVPADLMEQLMGIQKNLAQPQVFAAAPNLHLPDRSHAARARIVARAIARQPIGLA